MIGEFMLVIWILTGPAAPTTPVPMTRYSSEEECETWKQRWRKTPTPDTRVILYDAVCIPAGITQAATAASAPVVVEPKKEPEPPKQATSWFASWFKR